MAVWNRNTRKASFTYPGEDIQATSKTRVTLVGDNQRAVETGRARLLVTAGLFTFAFLSISVRLIDLMVLNGALDTGPSYATNAEGSLQQFRSNITGLSQQHYRPLIFMQTQQKSLMLLPLLTL